MLEYLIKLYNYNHWSTEVLIDFIEKKKINSNDVNRLLSHLLNLTFIRYQNINPAFHTSFGLWQIHSADKFRELNNTISSEIVAHLTGMKPRNAVEKMHSLSTDGEEILVSKGDMFIHIANHAAHHRGQICHILRDLGYTPPGIGYLRYTISFPEFW